MNNNYYPSPLSPDEMQRHQHHMAQQRRAHQHQQQQNGHIQGRNLAMINTSVPGDVPNGPHSAMPDIPMSGDSLDDIILQNDNVLHRRRSVPHPYGSGQMGPESPGRRMSFVDFGNVNGAFGGYQYANMVPGDEGMGGGYGGMGNNMEIPGTGPFQSNLMDMSDHPDFANLSPDMMGDMMDFSNLNVGSMADPNALNMYNSQSMGGQYPPTTLGPVNTDFSMDLGVENDPLSAASTNPNGGLGIKADDDMMGVENAFAPREEPQTTQAHTQPSLSIDPSLTPYHQHQNLRPTLAQEMPGTTAFQSPISGGSRTISQASAGPTTSNNTAATPTPGTPATSAPTEQKPSGDGKSIYSKSGFDMLRALWYVASRKNQKLNIGAVDMSCAFVVCDVTLNDCPIIYVSDNFQNLTGYNRHEIIGKNCRFLQSPDGKVEAGTKREFVENGAVYHLKEAIARGEEIQQSLINYRKGGKPFLNLLTMIPIPWDNPNEIRYFIGFQIDLVECPDAVSGREASGAMNVNYNQSTVGPYIWDPPNQSQWAPDSGQTLSIDDVSTLLQNFQPRGITSDWHRQSWDKMLLENADDIVHVLSLKGIFHYLSPSCKRILGYDAGELLGTQLNDVCHPSDIVPVMRELKEAQMNTPVNVVYRIMKKNGGYTWFEAHGSLFNEQGKGKKCIILVGRKRPVFALRKSDLEAHGGIGDTEIWTKVSTSGMFLFVSSAVRSLLDLHPENLIGTSMQDLMRKETRPEFGRTIEKARQGRIVSCKHEVQNKRGQVLQAHTTFYPGDVAEGQMPSFLLAQTKLLKASSRAIAPATGPNKGTGSGTTVPGDLPSASTATAHAGMVGRSPDENSGALVLAESTSGDTALQAQQEDAIEAEDNMFEELKPTRCTSWQYELRQMEKVNRTLAEELATLLSNRKKRKRRKGGNMVRDCANCHTRSTPEWRRGPSGNRDLCNSCGLRWAKQTGRVSPRNSSRGGNGDTLSKKSNSPIHSSPLHREVSTDTPSLEPASKTTATPASTATNDDYGSASTPVAAAVNSAMAAAKAAGNGVGGLQQQHQQQQGQQQDYNPPQSRRLLEGGSGLGGGGMEMTAIQEEWETSA